MTDSVPSHDVAWRDLHRAACAPYRAAGRFAWHFARGKLGHDPVFRQLFERRLLGDGLPGRVVDIGCGQGLLASLLHHAALASAATQSPWPAPWPAAGRALHYTGIELMPRDVQRAHGALQPCRGLDAEVVCADMCTAPLPPADLVVILDVLHYVPVAAQDAVLARVRDALRAGTPARGSAAPGRLLLRVGDAASRRGFAVSQWVDRAVTRIRGHRVSPTWGRTVAQWVAVLEGLGFAVEAQPMSAGTPFANVLLVADLHG